MPNITILNVSTGEMIEREMNEAELEQREKDKVAIQDAVDELDRRAEAKKLAKSKLQALGLDEADLKALGLQARTIYKDNGETMRSGYSASGANR